MKERDRTRQPKFEEKESAFGDEAVSGAEINEDQRSDGEGVDGDNIPRR
jgi:hypothetical protein